MDISIIINAIQQLVTSFDHSILLAFHQFAVATNGFFTPFFRFISYFGDSGIFLVLLSLTLICIKKTRRIGLTMLLALCIGAIFTNLTLKNLVARERMFSDTTSVYYQWWQYAGATMEHSFSFPSGHVTAAMSSMTALFICIRKKKLSFLCFVFVLLMAASRNYLMVHYPTDVVMAMIIGGISGIMAHRIINKFYLSIKRQSNSKLHRYLF